MHVNNIHIFINTYFWAHMRITAVQQQHKHAEIHKEETRKSQKRTQMVEYKMSETET